jgi:Acetyltransferase (GNAT) domain
LHRIREFEANDIEQVANLHRNVFKLEEQPTDQYHAYFSERFLSRDDDSLPSLVCEAEHGRILGFLGVASRHFSFGSRKITAALSSQFVVDPEARHQLIAIHLLREFFNGRQDFSFTDEASDVSQKIWVALGGSVAPLRGIHWILPLRPVRLACQKYAPPWIANAVDGTAQILGRVISSIPHSTLRNSVSVLRGEPLSAEAMLACLDELTPQCRLRPRYDAVSLNELIEYAGRKSNGGPLRKVLLRDSENGVAGWYLYYREANGLAEVLQIASREDNQTDVVEHMASDARTHGANALVGRLEPGLAQPLANRFCLLFRRQYAMLIHSRYPEIRDAIHSQGAFISRLDGEWCLRFA